MEYVMLRRDTTKKTRVVGKFDTLKDAYDCVAKEKKDTPDYRNYTYEIYQDGNEVEKISPDNKGQEKKQKTEDNCIHVGFGSFSYGFPKPEAGEEYDTFVKENGFRPEKLAALQDTINRISKRELRVEDLPDGEDKDTLLAFAKIVKKVNDQIRSSALKPTKDRRPQ